MVFNISSCRAYAAVSSSKCLGGTFNPQTGDPEFVSQLLRLELEDDCSATGVLRLQTLFYLCFLINRESPDFRCGARVCLWGLTLAGALWSCIVV